MIARCDGIVQDWGSTNEAQFCLHAFLSTVLLFRQDFAPIRFGIFGQATTKAASPTKTGRWWYGGC